MALAASLALAGGSASAWTGETIAEESVYQALSAMDTAQSVQMAKHPCCYHELAPITADVLGPHPTQRQTIAWGVGRGVLHLGVTAILEANDTPLWVRRTWAGLTIVTQGITVGRNHSVGLYLTSCRGAP